MSSLLSGSPTMIASIILINFNGSGNIERCLRSLEQEVDNNCEILIVDNASSDGSAEYIEERYPRHTLIRNNKNVGFAEACNQAAKLAAGQYLVYLNPDTRVQYGWLRGLIEPLDYAKKVGLTTSVILQMSDPALINTCGLDIHYSGLSFARGFNSRDSELKTLEYISAVSGASFAIKACTWEQLEGFDERLFMYFEDTDLSWRAQLVGYSSLLAIDSVVEHVHHPNRSRLSLYYSERNRWVLILKNWRIITILLLSPGLAITELVIWVYLASIGFSAMHAKIQGYFWLISNLSYIIESRRSVQESRRISDHQILKNRVWKLKPKEVTGGLLGSLAVSIPNLLFHVNHIIALKLLRFFGL